MSAQRQSVPKPDDQNAKPDVTSAATGPEQEVSAGEDALAPEPAGPPMYIREYRVLGAHKLPPLEVEEAVYPYLGPARTREDVKQARAALEKAYQAKGFQTCTVSIPPQQPRHGVVFLQVTEGTVGRLRVTGSRYYSPAQIKAMAPSLAEGKVVDFTNVTRDIVALNESADRTVTPSIRSGVDPGTYDVDLAVKDKLPLHGSVELNNRYSANTPELRLNGSLSYANLWQLGHTIGFNYQVSPENAHDVAIYSGYYIAKVPGVDWLSIMVQGTKQDSNVNSLGDINVAGRGQVIGARALVTLPHSKDYFQSLSFGFDYKHFDQLVGFGLANTLTPITYYPITFDYSGTLTSDKVVTVLDVGLTFGIRALGSSSKTFDINRYNSDGNFVYLRGDLSQTWQLPKSAEAFIKVQGQLSPEPLVNSEQIGGGGLGTVRGYLESEVLGDSGVFGTVELRSPSLLGVLQKGKEWRVYAFSDVGEITLRNSLPGQDSYYDLASYGVGSRLQLFDHLNGSVDAAFPLISQSSTSAHDFRLTFRVWADF